MVHLQLDIVVLNGICNFLEYFRFDGAGGDRKGGGPLMVVHGDERVG